MSWGINTNATEKEKMFAEYNDSLKGMNSADGLSYHHYSQIYDLGRELADREYEQGVADGRKMLADKLLNFQTCEGENGFVTKNAIINILAEFELKGGAE